MIQGKIEKVDKTSGTGKTGKPFERWTFAIGGLNYSTFDSTIGNVFKIGDIVEIDGAQEGKYFNMKSMKKIDSITNPQEKSSQNGYNEENQARICRMNCVTNALKYYEINRALDKSYNTTVEEIADRFFQYVWTGESRSGSVLNQ